MSITPLERKTITRHDLAEQVFREIGLSHSESAELVNQFFDLVIDELMEDHVVKMSNFGSLIAKKRGKRIGRNPKTGEVFEILPHMAVSFRPSQKLKKEIDEKLKQIKGIPKE